MFTFRFSRTLITSGLLLASVILPAAAQTEAINGSIRGHVSDAAAAAVAGAKVTIVNVDTGFTRSGASGDDGTYVFPNLPLGTYTVTIQKEGFESERHTGVVLTAGTEAVVEGQLKVGTLATEVEVTGGGSIVEPSRVSTGRTITNVEIENLPLTSRNPYNFIIFQPGVSGHPNPELGIPRTLNTNGLLDRINYQMDGMVDTESDRYGLRLFPISDVYVREVQTVSNSYAPEFGNTAGDIFNVITNSGTNTPHGEFYYLGRPTDLTQRPMLLALSSPKPDLTLQDFAVNAGGPVIKDKLFVFGGYEHLKRAYPQANTIDPTQAALLGISSSLLANAPQVQHAQFFNVRVDWVVNSKNQVFLRYNYFRNEYPFNTAVGAKNALDAAADFHDRAHVIGAQVLTTFSPSVLNELRFGWPYRNERHVADPITGAGPQISISGIANFNGSVSTGDRFQEKIPNLNDAVTVVRGKHTMKYGFGFQQMLDTQTNDVYSQYVFSSVANYLAAKSGANPKAYSQYNTVIGLPGAWYHSFFWNWFAQDSVQVSRNLLLIFGVRYDRFQGPPADPTAPFSYSQHFRTPGKDFAPRLGLAWSLDSKTVVRASSGIFFEPVPTNLWYNVFTNSGNATAYNAAILPTQSFAPSFPQVIAFTPGAVSNSSSDIITITPDFRNAYTVNTNLQITRSLSGNDSLTAGYVNTGARALTYLRNINPINPVSFLADGRPVYSTAVSAATRLDPRFNNITLQDVGAVTDYNALIVSYAHRLTKGIDVSASYTWSHSISDAPDANSFEQNVYVEDNSDRRRDRGNSLVNRPSAFTMSAVLAPTTKSGNRTWNWLANNNQLALLVNTSSGDQQNITANRNLNNDAKAVTRPLFIGRDSVRGPNISQIDMRYTRAFFTAWERLKPKFIAEANNVFGWENITSLNTVVPVDTTGLPTQPITGFLPSSTVLEKRIIQFGVRLDW
ncbi:MAG TPA: carboxypeptidase regulatory-like domain-containing protein [Bryobacteraceae bacterium]|nr:carboxypeptidase regulatory-like domain-containing protein [Bryobacteraceae bacterium]